MGMSRSARIALLLVIDVFFFFVELIVGYAVGSLALIADSFHMLNDVMSLVVALYAIKLAASTEPNSRYSYGWHRAEILAALVNGVFLLALCFSILLKALERFFDTPEVSNPHLVVLVGLLGLASNIIGLFLFHAEHGHSHGHTHDHSSSKSPHLVVPSSSGYIPVSVDSTQKRPPKHPDECFPPPTGENDETYPSFYRHPAATRASLVLTAQEIAQARSPSPTLRRQSLSQGRRRSSVADIHILPERSHSISMTELLNNETAHLSPSSTENTAFLQEELITDHHHSHGHSHSGSMNMRALVLHVVGDALGNVGVIATGLVIWKTSWSFKYYFDPIISLIITLIIFSSALPLVRSASFILLQGVPSTVSLDDVKKVILVIPGIISLHELHVWQLSETKLVASVHIVAERKYDFMQIAEHISRALDHLGIYSCTIQPEYTQGDRPLTVKGTEESSCLILRSPNQACDPTQNARCLPPVDV